MLYQDHVAHFQELEQQCPSMEHCDNAEKLGAFLLDIYKTTREIAFHVIMCGHRIELVECDALTETMERVAKAAADLEVQYGELLMKAEIYDDEFDFHKLHQKLRERAQSIQNYVETQHEMRFRRSL